MKTHRVLVWLYKVSGLLAALGPGLHVVHLIRARDFTRTFRQYGPLPEIHILATDCVALASAILLLTVVLLDGFRPRPARRLAKVALGGLWLFYVPRIWDQVTGTDWFARVTNVFVGFPWQMLAYQTVATICAVWLKLRQGETQRN